MRRALPVTAAVLAVCGSLLSTPASTASPTSTAVTAKQVVAKKKTPTPFALAATGYGTKVQGGSVPVGSDSTAYQAIGCTTMAGTNKGNYEANATLPGLGRLVGVRTRLWTEKKGGTVSSYSTHSIARVVLGESPLGTLEIRGLRSTSRAFHRGKHFHAQTRASVASIVFDPATGPAQSFDIPAPGQPIDIPGVARIGIGHSNKKVTRHGARAAANVLDVYVYATDTRVQVAQSVAKIGGGIHKALFRGYSAGLRARGLADNVKVGRTPLNLMACTGTYGKVVQRDIARVDLNDQIVVRGVATAQVSKQSRRRAQGVEAARVAHISLGDGAVEINGINAVANVKRVGKRLIRSSKGTNVGEIVANGTTYEFPKTGVLEIPGLVKLEDRVVKRVKNGLFVIGLRITLLDGTGAVIDLGLADMRLRQVRTR